MSIQPFGKECNRKNQNTVSSNDRFKSCTFVLLWFSTLPVFSLVWRFSGGSPHVFSALTPPESWNISIFYSWRFSVRPTHVFPAPTPPESPNTDSHPGLAILPWSNLCLLRPDTPCINTPLFWRSSAMSFPPLSRSGRNPGFMVKFGSV